MSVIGFCSAELLLARFLGTPQALFAAGNTVFYDSTRQGSFFQFGY